MRFIVAQHSRWQWLACIITKYEASDWAGMCSVSLSVKQHAAPSPTITTAQDIDWLSMSGHSFQFHHLTCTITQLFNIFYRWVTNYWKTRHEASRWVLDDYKLSKAAMHSQFHLVKHAVFRPVSKGDSYILCSWSKILFYLLQVTTKKEAASLAVESERAVVFAAGCEKMLCLNAWKRWEWVELTLLSGSAPQQLIWHEIHAKIWVDAQSKTWKQPLSHTYAHTLSQSIT